MGRCPDIPEWQTEWLDDMRLVKRRGPFRCVTHTGGQSHGIGTGEVMFGLRIPDMGIAISQLLSTGEYLEDRDLYGRPIPNDLRGPKNYGTDFHSTRPHFEEHSQSADAGGCDLMGSLPCWSDFTYTWDDAFEAWRDNGEDAIWPVLEKRLLEWVADHGAES